MSDMPATVSTQTKVTLNLQHMITLHLDAASQPGMFTPKFLVLSKVSCHVEGIVWRSVFPNTHVLAAALLYIEWHLVQSVVQGAGSLARLVPRSASPREQQATSAPSASQVTSPNIEIDEEHKAGAAGVTCGCLQAAFHNQFPVFQLDAVCGC